MAAATPDANGSNARRQTAALLQLVHATHANVKMLDDCRAPSLALPVVAFVVSILCSRLQRHRLQAASRFGYCARTQGTAWQVRFFAASCMPTKYHCASDAL